MSTPASALDDEAIRGMAGNYHESFGIDVGREEDCLRRLRLAAREDAQPHAIPARLLRDALGVLGPGPAASLILGADLADLTCRIRLTEYLFADEAPLCTLRELAARLREFADYLRTWQGELERGGMAPEPFEPSLWLHWGLGNLYPTRQYSGSDPLTTAPPAIRVMGGGQRPPPTSRPGRTWYQTPGDKHFGRDIRACSYDRADPLNGLDVSDLARLEALRPCLFALKLSLVGRVENAVRLQAPRRFWDDCAALLIDGLSADDACFLGRMDGFYTGSVPRPADDEPPRPFFHCPADEELPGPFTPGGLTAWLALIWHAEKELSAGPMAAAMSAGGGFRASEE